MPPLSYGVGLARSEPLNRSRIYAQGLSPYLRTPQLYILYYISFILALCAFLYP